MENSNLTGYTCTKCGKVFENVEEFKKQHKNNHRGMRFIHK
jgi:DNA-directed RNA polymerase subunit RPC12/RpoP